MGPGLLLVGDGGLSGPVLVGVVLVGVVGVGVGLVGLELVGVLGLVEGPGGVALGAPLVGSPLAVESTDGAVTPLSLSFSEVPHAARVADPMQTTRLQSEPTN